MSTGERSGGLPPAQLIAKWSRVDLPERAASQEHFIDLCRLLGHPLSARRAEVDQQVLANLLRLNLARAGREEGEDAGTRRRGDAENGRT